MNDLNGLLLLRDYICRSAYLKAEDHKVVHRLCEGLAASNELGLVNEDIRWQIQAEASVIYLVTRYREMVDAMQRILDDYKAGKLYEEDGLSWSKDKKHHHLMATDADYGIRYEKIMKVSSLLRIFEKLERMVFSRDGKLEQLSVNYRKEQEVDRRTG